MKGVFKNYPIVQQPERIPLNVYNQLQIEVKRICGRLFKRMFSPDATRKAFGKTDTGDLDVVVVPKNLTDWVKDILEVFENDDKVSIVAYKENGPQLMCVMQNLLGNGKRYMIDFLLTTLESFEFKKFFIGHGTIFPALMGSFARSHRYKYDSQAFYIRLQDKKGNFHNIELTKNVNEMFAILYLEPVEFGDERLFTPEGVVDWITSSPRYSKTLWNKPEVVEGQTVVTENRKAHAAAKKKPEVQKAYELIRVADRKGIRYKNNYDYSIERAVLGNQKVENMLNQVNTPRQGACRVLTGNQIMDLINIPPSPIVGKWIKWLLEHEEFKSLKQEDLLTEAMQQKAKELLINEYNRRHCS